MKPLIAVSGKNGQLGWELEKLSSLYPQFQFIFTDKDELDITDTEQLRSFFQKSRPAVFINCAAYTAVDKAETEQVIAYKVNAEALGSLALECKEYDTLLISFSTDYVFDGKGTEPYKEDHSTHPVNYYGYTKQVGEQLALQNWEKTIIIRTSWVYSAHGNNFVKTMLRLMKQRSDITVVNDQLGSPTYAKDLAEAVMMIVDAFPNNDQRTMHNGIYHFSNDGVISWFDFASAIKERSGLSCDIHPIPTTEFPTPAKRPHYSVLDKGKIVSDFDVQLKDWKQSLADCIAVIYKKSGL
jgi:dTDP-4-dehydrorhamnose reductase